MASSLRNFLRAESFLVVKQTTSRKIIEIPLSRGIAPKNTYIYGVVSKQRNSYKGERKKYSGTGFITLFVLEHNLGK